MTTEMGPSTVHDQHGGVRYHRRYLKPTPFVTAAFTTLGFGAAIVILHSGIVTMLGLIAIFTLLTGCYLEGPAKSVTVRNDTLEVRNSFFRYVIPPARIVAIDYVADFGVRVRVEGGDVIRVGAFSRSQLRFRRLSDAELQANARSLTDALFATPAPADQRQLKRGYRWVNLLLVAACVTGLLVFNAVVNKS